MKLDRGKMVKLQSLDPLCMVGWLVEEEEEEETLFI
jgi:hypothetical protein